MRWTWDERELWIDPVVLAAGRTTKFEGTAGDDRLVGTEGRDKFDVSQGGDDVLHGKGGRDEFDFGAAFTRGDVVHGDGGRDSVVLAGRYSTPINLDPLNLRAVEFVGLGGSNTFNYSVVIEDGFTGLKIGGKSAGHLDVDGAAVTTGLLKIIGSDLSDTLVGGAGDDRIDGRVGDDTISGGGGNDRFIYPSEAFSDDKFGDRPDTITDFSLGDAIWLPDNKVDVYHVGMTAERSGDVLASYDSSENRTTVRVFIDADDAADMTIYLTGDKSAVEIVHHSHIVLAG